MNENSHIWHRGLDILADLAWLAVEIPLFLPADVLTVRVRDAVIPRMVKKRLPFLSCRRYNGFNPRVGCGPAAKYTHEGLFKVVVCRHYDVSSGKCNHPKLRGA